VTVDVFDARGRRVRRLQDGVLPAGRHRITWDGADARGRAQGSGVYLVRVQSGSEIATRKLSLVR
jgi:flagellar hook assembly protein FlgD